MNVASRNPETPEARGDRHLAAKDFAAAAAAFEEAAASVELAAPELCVRLARALLASGDPAGAAERAIAAARPEAGFRVWNTAAGLLSRCPVETWPRIRRRLETGLLATWTTSGFAPLLRLACARAGIALEITEPDFGQYFNASLDPGSALNAAAPEAVLLFPEHRAPGLPAFSDDPQAALAAETARWSAAWDGLRREGQPILVQAGFAAPPADPLGHLASALPGSRRAMLAGLNRALAEAAVARDVGFLDTAALAARLGRDGFFDDRGWHMAKMPFAPAALPHLATHAAAVLAARLGLSRRVAVLDLDNTLWGGVIGDDGPEGITLGGTAAGEAFQDFQAALKELAARGVVLAVASKNDAEVARAPFREHPEMVLREDDIAAFAASWGPKSESLKALSETLSLGLDSFVFLDDNPYERAEVRRALPEVEVPVLPEDPTGFRRLLEDYPHFEPAGFTEADRARSGQYRARARAIELKESAGSLEDYQASLAMEAEIGAIDAVNMARVVQLINKTNQFNLTTVRRNRAELEAFLARPGAHGFWLRLADKFADHGLILVALAEAKGGVLEIDTLLMSCRVLGRGVEATAMAELARIAAAAGCGAVAGTYRPSGRNAMVADLYPRLGFAPDSEGPEGDGPDGETRWRAAAADLTDPGAPILVRRA